MCGEKLFAGNKTAEAEKVYKRAFTFAQACDKSGEATHIVAFCHYRLADIYESRGEHDKALSHCRLMHGVLKEKSSVTEEERASMLTGYGTLLSRAGKKQDATQIYLEAIEAYERANTNGNKKYYTELGTIYDYVTVMAAEARAWKDAIMVGMLAVRNHGMSSDMPVKLEKQANSYRNLAYIYGCNGDKEMAVTSYESAINNYKRLIQSHGDKYINHLTETFNSLISFYKNNSVSLNKVEEAYLDVIAVFENLCLKDIKRYGENLASLYDSLSNVVSGIFNMKKSKEYKNKANEIRAKLK